MGVHRNGGLKGIISISISLSISIYIYIHMYIYLCGYIYRCIYTQKTSLHACLHTYTIKLNKTHTVMHVCLYDSVCILMGIYIYICVYTWTILCSINSCSWGFSARFGLVSVEKRMLVRFKKETHVSQKSARFPEKSTNARMPYRP